jgi:riboflavin biosynthesis pyrimidine reductase
MRKLIYRRLKEEPGKDLAVGGAGLASTFIELGLVDECSRVVCIRLRSKV